MANEPAEPTEPTKSRRDGSELPTRPFGQLGWNVTQLGYGSMGLRGPNTWGVRVVSDEDAEIVLNRVLDAGINFIDTAPDYGVAEERIGRAIGHRRSEFYLATKCGCAYMQHDDHIEIKHTWSQDVVRRNVETSLQRMQTDYLDLLQFHGGDAESLQAAGLIDLLVELRSTGVIRAMGMSSKLPDLPALIDLNVFDSFQIPYSCLAPEHESWISQAATAGAGVIIRGGVAHGGPDAEIERPALNKVWDRARLDELVPDGVSRAQFILRYTLSHPHCHTSIVGTCNAEHLAENIQAANAGPLPPETLVEVRRRVDKLNEN